SADGREVLVLEAVALVVLVTELAEELREGELDPGGLELVPGGRAEEVAADGGVDGLHLLDAEDGRAVVAAGLDLGRRREHGDGAGGAGGLVAAGGDAAEGGVRLEEEGADVALLRVQLGGEVADVGGLDLLRVELGDLEGALDGLAHHRDEVL